MLLILSIVTTSRVSRLISPCDTLDTKLRLDDSSTSSESAISLNALPSSASSSQPLTLTLYEKSPIANCFAALLISRRGFTKLRVRCQMQTDDKSKHKIAQQRKILNTA